MIICKQYIFNLSVLSSNLSLYFLYMFNFLSQIIFIEHTPISLNIYNQVSELPLMEALLDLDPQIMSYLILLLPYIGFVFLSIIISTFILALIKYLEFKGILLHFVMLIPIVKLIIAVLPFSLLVLNCIIFTLNGALVLSTQLHIPEWRAWFQRDFLPASNPYLRLGAG